MLDKIFFFVHLLTTLLTNQVGAQMVIGTQQMQMQMVPPQLSSSVSSTASFTPAISPGKHGDPCLYPSQCDSNAKLLCRDNFCRCSSPEHEAYDSVREQCAIREGQRCTPPKFLFGENNPCVSNSLCSESKRVCECEGHAFPDRKGNCSRKKAFNETCSTSRECDESKYLSCEAGICSCKLSTFDEYHQICRRKVGQSCSRMQECVPNTECLNEKCVCKEGFSETSTKNCGLAYAKSCGGGGGGVEGMTNCSDIYFACVNGICRCKNPSYEVFDNVTGTCLSLVGGLCHLFLPSNLPNNQPLKLKSCTQNAECVRRDLSSLSQCECEAGFVETLAGHCRLPFGAVCAIPGQNVQECAEPLVCKNMKCECQNENDIYDPVMKSCRRIVGSMCSEVVGGLNNECTFNSECVSYRCTCNRGFLPTFRGDCIPEGGMVQTTSNYLFNLGEAVSQPSGTGKPFTNNINILYDTSNPMSQFNYGLDNPYQNQLLTFQR